MNLLEDSLRKAVGRVPKPALASLREQSDALVATVNRTMRERDDLPSLLGGNAIGMMERNHGHHLALMRTVLLLDDLGLLVRVLPWVYRAYHSRGFLYDYFPAELSAWREAVTTHLGENDGAEEIRAIYSWMLDAHERVIALVEDGESRETEPHPFWRLPYERFLTSLLRGDAAEALSVAYSRVRSVTNLTPFYLQVLQPALYEVGRRWETGTISVAQEHVATRLANMVMAALSLRIRQTPTQRGRVVIASAADEQHELGGQIVAELLGADGWDVSFVGAATPSASLLEMIREAPPDVLGLSATIPFALEKVYEMIEAARAVAALRNVRIMVGGLAFADSSTLWRAVGADGTAADGAEAVQLADRWWKDRQSSL